MSQGQPAPVGFVMPPNAPQNPGYPPQPQVYPPQPQVYPPQPQVYPTQYQPVQQQMYAGNQPLPAPIQQQPIQYGNPQGAWYGSNISAHLTNATGFLVEQETELAEILLGFETANSYTVTDQRGNKIFHVGEESNCCNRQICQSRRGFTLKVKDTAGQPVLDIVRQLDCSCCCGLCCADAVQVTTPGGQLLGSVVEEFHILYPSFTIRDAAGNSVLNIQGPLCPQSFGPCAGSVVFNVTHPSGASVGTISKEWSGFIKEIFTDADKFAISFQANLDPSIKAVLLAALFLIDFEYFEKSTRDESQGGRRLAG
jgi:hypothetical protein